MWELDYREGWVPKNWCFKLWCWRRLLRVPQTTRRSNQPTLKKINREYSFIGKTAAVAQVPILWPPDANSRLIGKDHDAGKDWKQKERGWQRMRWLDGTTNSMDMNWSKLRERVEGRGAWCATVCEITESDTTRDWKTKPATLIHCPIHNCIST